MAPKKTRHFFRTIIPRRKSKCSCDGVGFFRRCIWNDEVSRVIPKDQIKTTKSTLFYTGELQKKKNNMLNYNEIKIKLKIFMNIIVFCFAK